MLCLIGLFGKNNLLGTEVIVICGVVAEWVSMFNSSW